MGEIRVGTSGFGYDDWRGVFYPEKLKKGEMLRYYASRFSTVEINTTFYGIPAPKTFVKMADTTPPGFDFAVKANKELTHNPEVDPGVFASFTEALKPLLEAGKLACVLAQYPWSFRKNEENVGRLRQLRERFGDLPVVVELRNAEWVEEETFDLLKDCRLAFCCVDEPRLKGLMPRVGIVTAPPGYVRFHGRNAKKWWQHEESWERYDYLYTPEELSEWVPRVGEISAAAEKTYLFFNNHYKGQAAQNAVMFADMLGLPTESKETFISEQGQGSLFGMSD